MGKALPYTDEFLPSSIYISNLKGKISRESFNPSRLRILNSVSAMMGDKGKPISVAKICTWISFHCERREGVQFNTNLKAITNSSEGTSPLLQILHDGSGK